MPMYRALTDEQQLKIDAQMHLAIRNFMGHARRSLLDFIDLERSRHPDEASEKFWELIKKRIHNDIAMVESQMNAAYEIAIHGGIIPPFGRSEQQVQADRIKNGSR